MIKKNTIFLDGRKIGTYKAVLTAGSGHIDFNGFEPYESRLTDNQQVVLEWLEGSGSGAEGSLIRAIHSLYHLNLARDETFLGRENLVEVRSGLRKLSRNEEAQVLQAFATWALEQEDDK